MDKSDQLAKDGSGLQFAGPAVTGVKKYCFRQGNQ